MQEGKPRTLGYIGGSGDVLEQSSSTQAVKATTHRRECG